MVKKKCNKVNCFNLISFTEKYCEKHKEENNKYDKQRFNNDKEVRQTYNTSRWKTIRKQTLIRDMHNCLYCLHNGIYTRATVVDHYIPVRDAYERRYDATNLISSCSACNTRKAVDEDKLRSNQITLEEFKSRWQYDVQD
ncbi:HNH endonuclease [Staphylococcus shinii]|uniref:HNH endonuclease n=1 Tax=Staphylococcus shinii TaxID=2912228 RepID=UPI003F85AAD7